MITDIEDYFRVGCGRCERFATEDCSTQQWREGLLQLRRICLEAGLEEHVKWAHPCYMAGGRNVAIFGAFRGDFRLSFFHAALMRDEANVLEKQGPNTAHADMIRFTRNEQVAEMEELIRAYLQEAIGYAEAGILPQKETREVDMPPELMDAFAMDPELADAFHNLTPGRQRGYVFNLTSAKKSATRIARIEKFRPRILEGKGVNER